MYSSIKLFEANKKIKSSLSKVLKTFYWFAFVPFVLLLSVLFLSLCYIFLFIIFLFLLQNVCGKKFQIIMLCDKGFIEIFLHLNIELTFFKCFNLLNRTESVLSIGFLRLFLSIFSVIFEFFSQPF